MRPVLVPDAQILTDEQGAKAGAIEEEVALNALAIVERERGNVATFSIKLDLVDLAFDTSSAVAFRHAAQELRIQS